MLSRAIFLSLLLKGKTDLRVLWLPTEAHEALRLDLKDKKQMQCFTPPVNEKPLRVLYGLQMHVPWLPIQNFDKKLQSYAWVL